MKALLLETERTGYSPDQVFRTMTVAELIEALSDYDENTPVYFSNDRGYTYGGISYESFREYEEDEPEGEDLTDECEYVIPCGEGW